jgi:membrane-associated phospholipid phosphatase
MSLVAGSLAIGGAVVLVAAIAWARHDRIPTLEMRVFRAVNGLPDRLYVPLWVPMQFGNFWVAVLCGLGAAAALGEVAIAVAVVVAAIAKLVVQRVLRQRVAAFVEVRQRPGTSEPGAILRGKDVPSAGPSFPSGHVIIAASIAALLSEALDPAVVWLPWTATVLVMVGRVYVGAHNPLDVLAGLGAGTAIGGVLALVLV